MEIGELRTLSMVHATKIMETIFGDNYLQVVKLGLEMFYVKTNSSNLLKL